MRSIATQETLREAAQRRPVYRPEVVDVMKEDPGATKKKITTQVKAKVQAADNAARLAHSAGLTVQGQTVRDFQGRAADLWSTTVQSLPERAFSLPSMTDTLPHNRSGRRCPPHSATAAKSKPYTTCSTTAQWPWRGDGRQT